VSTSPRPARPSGVGRRRRSRRQFMQATALAVLGSLGVQRLASAATLPPTVGTRQYGAPGDFVIATGVDITTLDPQQSTSASNLAVTFNLFDNLVTVGPDLTLQPGLATTWTLLDDRTWEFKLRPGVTFHNGDPLTARDVAFTINRTLDPAEQSAVDTVFSTVERIEVQDDLTIRFVTTAGDPLLPARLSFAGGQILPERYFKQIGADRFAHEPVGSGPIKFATWVPNDFSMYAANTAYWGGAPDFDRVIFQRMEQDRDRVKALLEGKAHIATRLSPEWRLRLTTRPEARPAAAPFAGLYVLAVNPQNKPLDNPLLRQALSLAINRDTIIRGMWLDRGLEPIGFVSKGDRVGYAPDLPPFTYSQDRARELLSQAGYAGEPVIFESTDGYLSYDAAMTKVIVTMWQRVGINVEVRWITRAERTEKNLARGFAGVWWSDPTSTLLDPDGMMFRLIAPGGIQDYWKDDEWLRLGTEARTSHDASLRERNYRRMQEIMLDQLPWIPIIQPEEGYGVRTEVTWQPSPNGMLELRRTVLAWHH
jgi:peptide/nickel transport system substrate-binding protein